MQAGEFVMQPTWVGVATPSALGPARAAVTRTGACRGDGAGVVREVEEAGETVAASYRRRSSYHSCNMFK